MLQTDKQQNKKIQAGLFWLRRGFWLLPAQANSKYNIAGFGVHRESLKTSKRLNEWFGNNEVYNLAVVGWAGSIILDFDDIEVYNRWVAACPDQAKSYTETTPRGGKHVFMFGQAEITPGRRLIPGVELKQSVIVSPSVVDGKPYQAGAGELLEVQAANVFLPISEEVQDQDQHAKQSNKVQHIATGKSLVSQIKGAVSPIDILTQARPAIKFLGLGRRWVTCRCPFHDDRRESFWIDTERGLWGCHACNVHGDTINLYAKLQAVTVNQAIEALAAEVLA